MLLLAGCAFSTIGVGYDPYVAVWVDGHPPVGEGQGATLSLESREERSSPRARVSVSRHEMPGGGGAALYWRLMGVTEIDTDSLLLAAGGPAAPYVSVGFGFEFIQYPEGVGENWTGNPTVSAAVGLRAREGSRLRWYVEGRGGLWVWLPGFPAWPFSSAWGAGAALSVGADFTF